MALKSGSRGRRAAARVKRRGRAAWLYAGLVAPLVLFFMLAEDIGEPELGAYDQRILLAVEQLHTAAATTALRGLTFFGGSWGAGILTLILTGALLWAHRRRDALFVLAVIGGGGILQYLVKLVFERPRPSVFPPLVDTFTSSYPSGHAMLSACLALVLTIVCWHTRWRWLAAAGGAVFALAVSFSRLYLGAHYLSDVIAGWCLALAWTSVVWLAFDLAGRRVAAPAL